MKSKLFILKLAIELFVIFSSITIVILSLIYIFKDNNKINIIILEIYAIIVIILLKILINHTWKLIKEISARFRSDNVSIEIIKIDTILSKEKISKEYAENKINEIENLMKNVEYFCSIENNSKFTIRTCNIITSILIILLIRIMIISILNIFTIYDKYIIGIIIIGIISLLLLLIKTLYISIIVKKKIMENYISI